MDTQIIETYYSYFDSSDAELDRMFKETYDRLDNERYAYLKKQNEINENSQYFFLTINPKPSVALGEFIKVINKLMSKKWLDNYLYVYEQRGEDLSELGKGFHFHLIFKKPKTLCYRHILRELSNSSKSLCDTSNPGVFNLKSISEEEKERKIVYITGRKADDAKHLKQDMDIIWRQNNNLLSHYNIGII